KRQSERGSWKDVRHENDEKSGHPARSPFPREASFARSRLCFLGRVLFQKVRRVPWGYVPYEARTNQGQRPWFSAHCGQRQNTNRPDQWTRVSGRLQREPLRRENHARVPFRVREGHEKAHGKVRACEQPWCMVPPHVRRARGRPSYLSA